MSAPPDWPAREWATLLPLAALVVALGFFPAPLLTAVSESVRDLLAVMGVVTTGLGGGGV